MVTSVGSVRYWYLCCSSMFCGSFLHRQLNLETSIAILTTRQYCCFVHFCCCKNTYSIFVHYLFRIYNNVLVGILSFYLFSNSLVRIFQIVSTKSVILHVDTIKIAMIDTVTILYYGHLYTKNI